MRLFRYISGANESDQKIAMTTPVFMESVNAESGETMGFVMPKEVAIAGVPSPKAAEVKICKRRGGRFAVIRFSGRMDSKAVESQEAKLRRNQVLVRLKNLVNPESPAAAPSAN